MLLLFKHLVSLCAYLDVRRSELSQLCHFMHIIVHFS
jgi:hypothetical protein